MDEHDGWLLDLYPDDHGLTLWLLGDDGARRRLSHAFPVTFYAAGPFPRLRALWAWLRDQAPAPHLRRERRLDLFAGELDVLAMEAPGPAAQARLLDRVLARFPDLDYYDADVPAPGDLRAISCTGKAVTRACSSTPGRPYSPYIMALAASMCQRPNRCTCRPRWTTWP